MNAWVWIALAIVVVGMVGRSRRKSRGGFGIRPGAPTDGGGH